VLTFNTECICDDLNGHRGADLARFKEAHGGFGFGSRNVLGQMLLEFCESNELDVANTWSKKRDSNLVTYEVVVWW